MCVYISLRNGNSPWNLSSKSRAKWIIKGTLLCGNARFRENRIKITLILRCSSGWTRSPHFSVVWVNLSLFHHKKPLLKASVFSDFVASCSLVTTGFCLHFLNRLWQTAPALFLLCSEAEGRPSVAGLCSDISEGLGTILMQWQLCERWLLLDRHY